MLLTYRHIVFYLSKTLGFPIVVTLNLDIMSRIKPDGNMPQFNIQLVFSWSLKSSDIHIYIYIYIYIFAVMTATDTSEVIYCSRSPTFL